MAYEAEVVELYGENASGDQRRYTVADGAAISYGVLCALSDPRTAAAATGSKTVPAIAAGIAAADKENGDGSTTLSLYTNGVFELRASGAIVAGQAVSFVNDNHVCMTPQGATAASGAVIAGYALETAADAEVVNVRIKL